MALFKHRQWNSINAPRRKEISATGYVTEKVQWCYTGARRSTPFRVFPAGTSKNMNIETDDCRSNDLTGPRTAPGYMTHSAEHWRKNGSLGGKMALHFDICTTRGATILPTFTNITAREATSGQERPKYLHVSWCHGAWSILLCQVYETKWRWLFYRTETTGFLLHN